jgi:hypothetical protein
MATAIGKTDAVSETVSGAATQEELQLVAQRVARGAKTEKKSADGSR